MKTLILMLLYSTISISQVLFIGIDLKTDLILTSFSRENLVGDTANSRTINAERTSIKLFEEEEKYFVNLQVLGVTIEALVKQYEVSKARNRYGNIIIRADCIDTQGELTGSILAIEVNLRTNSITLRAFEFESQERFEIVYENSLITKNFKETFR